MHGKVLLKAPMRMLDVSPWYLLYLIIILKKVFLQKCFREMHGKLKVIWR